MNNQINIFCLGFSFSLLSTRKGKSCCFIERQTIITKQRRIAYPIYPTVCVCVYNILQGFQTCVITDPGREPHLFSSTYYRNQPSVNQSIGRTTRLVYVSKTTTTTVCGDDEVTNPPVYVCVQFFLSFKKGGGRGILSSLNFLEKMKELFPVFFFFCYFCAKFELIVNLNHTLFGALNGNSSSTIRTIYNTTTRRRN